MALIGRDVPASGSGELLKMENAFLFAMLNIRSSGEIREAYGIVIEKPKMIAKYIPKINPENIVSVSFDNKCPKCGSKKFIKRGKSNIGAQKFRCCCGKNWQLYFKEVGHDLSAVGR